MNRCIHVCQIQYIPVYVRKFIGDISLGLLALGKYHYINSSHAGVYLDVIIRLLVYTCILYMCSYTFILDGRQTLWNCVLEGARSKKNRF